jgi:hypothetical protein
LDKAAQREEETEPSLLKIKGRKKFIPFPPLPIKTLYKSYQVKEELLDNCLELHKIVLKNQFKENVLETKTRIHTGRGI